MRTLREYRKELLGNQYDSQNIGSLIEERKKIVLLLINIYKVKIISI